MRTGYCFLFKINASIRINNFLIIASHRDEAMQKAAMAATEIIKQNKIEDSDWSFSFEKELSEVIGFYEDKIITNI